MYLLQVWKESLRIFLPYNLKLFIATIFKSFFRSLFLWFRSFWWLMIIFLVANAARIFTFATDWGGSEIRQPINLANLQPNKDIVKFSSQDIENVGKLLHKALLIFIYIIYFMLLITWILRLRFQEAKEMLRYGSYAKHAAYIFFVLLVYTLLISFAHSPFKYIVSIKSISLSFSSYFALISISTLLWWPYVILVIHLTEPITILLLPAVFNILFVLFFFDRPANFRSLLIALKKSFMMIFTNYPAMWILSFVSIVPALIDSSKSFIFHPELKDYLAEGLHEVIGLFWVFLYICIVTTFYAKQNREHASLGLLKKS